MELVFVDSRGLGPVETPPRVIATLSTDAEVLVDRGLPPFEVMSGFEAAFFLAFRYGEARGYLEQRMAPEEGERTMLAVQGDADDTALLQAVLEAAGLDLDDCLMVADHIDRAAFPRWVLWRQDDNGTRVEVATFTGRRKADDQAARMEAGGHKQLYWVAAA